MNVDYETCKKESLFTLSEFGRTNIYVFEIKQKMFISNGRKLKKVKNALL